MTNTLAPDGCASQIQTYAKSLYPITTWEEESAKVLDGTEWQRSGASSIRSFKSQSDLMKARILAGEKVGDVFDENLRWLTACLWSCNMNNFK